ncbi:MAG: hypothetical protein K0S80_438 [Neobacillus sp.]|nr:hypothetical protein [Neobacillus sp.]
MYEVISFEDVPKWEKKMNELSKKDVFYRLCYSKLYQEIGDGDPYLFFFENEQGQKLCYSFLKRKLNKLPFLSEDLEGAALYDIITPSYGYGGPLYDHADYPLIQQFRREFEDYCKEENIITEFIRFHPLLQNQRYMENFLEVSYDRETVYVDLTKSQDELISDYHKNHKRNVTKAIKNNLEFRVFRGSQIEEQLKTFYEMYSETMDKLNASDYSYFSSDYLQNLVSGFEDHSIMGAVFYKDKMVAAALCMYDGGTLHYHLGCSKQKFLNLGTSIFMLHNIALWGKENGLQSFHLGGGHIGRDSLFQFKHRFNIKGTLDFYIGKKVHNPEIYKTLIGKWEEYYLKPSNNYFFPAYRSLANKVPAIIE